MFSKLNKVSVTRKPLIGTKWKTRKEKKAYAYTLQKEIIDSVEKNKDLVEERKR